MYEHSKGILNSSKNSNIPRLSSAAHSCISVFQWKLCLLNVPDMPASRHIGYCYYHHYIIIIITEQYQCPENLSSRHRDFQFIPSSLHMGSLPHHHTPDPNSVFLQANKLTLARNCHPRPTLGSPPLCWV